MSSRGGSKSSGSSRKGNFKKGKGSKGTNSISGYKFGKSSKREYKFSPLDSRYSAPQATFVTVVERLENEILKDFDKMAKHVAKSLVDGGVKDEPPKPKLARSVNPDATVAATENEEYAILGSLILGGILEFLQFLYFLCSPREC
jgi:hypothetical protein